MNTTDDELLGKAVDGDVDALSTLLERSGPQLQDRFEGKISAQWQAALDVTDVLQTTYLEAFLRIRQFNPNGMRSFAAWLDQIADNNLRDLIKSLVRAKRPDPRRRVERLGHPTQNVRHDAKLGAGLICPPIVPCV